MKNKKNLDELKKEIHDLINNDENFDKKKVSSLFNELMSLIYASMAYKSDNNTFFLYFLSRMEKEIDFELQAPAAVYLNESIFVLTLNPVLLTMFKIKEIKAIIIHEIYHIIHGHIKRLMDNKDKNVDTESTNIAMDCAINQFIFNLPEGCVTIEWIEKKYNINKLERYREWEYYYNEIINSSNYKEEMQKNKEIKKKLEDLFKELENSINNGNNNSNNSQGNDDNNNGNGNNIRKVSDILNDIKKIMEENNIVFAPDNHKRSGYGKKTIGVDVNKLIKELIESSLNSNSRGNTPNGILEALNKLSKKPQIKWQDILRNVLPSIKCPYKKTIRVRNRLQPLRYDLNGKIPDKKSNILIAIDTSGSMTDMMISNSLKEVYGIIKASNIFPDITVVECDCEINKIYKLQSEKDIQYKVSGRGGTCFTPVFKYIYEKRIKESITYDIIVYFTDGYGENEIPIKYKPVDSNLIWVINTHHYNKNAREQLSLNNPFTNNNFIKPLVVDER